MNENLKRLITISVITIIVTLVVFAITWLVFLKFFPISIPSSAPPSVIIPMGAKEPENLITPEEAMSEARKIPGFEVEKILQVKALLNDKNEIQYWLIKTKIGTVTVSAEPPPPKVVIPPNTVVSQGMVTPLEAARRVRQIKGYENEEIFEIYALADEMGNLQYWSVKTSRGFVTVEAK